MATARSAWGVDIGNRALKAVRVVRDGDAFKIDDFDLIEHEHVLSDAGDNRESLITSAIAQFAQRHNFKGSSIAIGVSGQSSFARFIKLPPVEPGKIPEIVRFEAIQQIPFPLDDVEWSYQLFQSPDSPEVEVGIFAMRKELVNQTIKYYTDVNLQVQAVQMNPLAVYNALYHDGRIKETTMIVDVGAENSDLIIAEGQNIWMRSIPIGGNNFTEALVKSFKLKFPKAEELKRNAATSKYGRQILQAMRPVFNDLVGEIQRSIGFYSSTHRDSRIGKVLALGGTFRLPGLQKYLKQNLQLEVERIDRLGAADPAGDAKFAATYNENILSAVAAYGLALQAMGEAKITSSLLPEEIRRERMWREKTKWFAAAAALFVAGTAVPVGVWYANQLATQSPAVTDTRNNITRVLNQGDGYDKRWSDIAGSGTEDRQHIIDYMGMLADRDTANRIVQGLAGAFPSSAPAAKTAKKPPRGQRETIELVGWKWVYQSDISRFLPAAMKDDEFNQQADKDAASLTAGAGAAAAPVPPVGYGYGSASPYGRSGAGGYDPMARRTMPGAAVPVAPPAGAPAAEGGQRGFLVTLQCRTPRAENPAQLVADKVAAVLRQENQNSPNPPKSFSIERVTIPTVQKVSAVFPAGTARPKKTPLVFTAPVQGSGAVNAAPMTGFADPRFQPSQPAGRNGFPPPGGGNRRPGPNGMFQPPGLPGTPGAEVEPPPDPFADPSNPGESTAEDSVVTILAAIVLDPPPKAADPNAVPAPGATASADAK